MSKKLKESTGHLNASLTWSEIETLEGISLRELGKKDKTNMIRFWINKYKNK